MYLQCSVAACLLCWVRSSLVCAQSLLHLLQAVVEWLTVQPQVHWISPRAQTKAANFFATGISQSGSAATLADASNAAGASGDAGTHPLWDAGKEQGPSQWQLHRASLTFVHQRGCCVQ